MSGQKPTAVLSKHALSEDDKVLFRFGLVLSPFFLPFVLSVAVRKDQASKVRLPEAAEGEG